MDDEGNSELIRPAGDDGATRTCQSIDWYAEGQSRTVEIAGVRITVRFIGRKGRRGRIAIEAPAGAVFTAVDDYDSQDGRRTGPT